MVTHEDETILSLSKVEDRYGVVVLLDALGTKNKSSEAPRQHVELFQSFVATIRQSFENDREWLREKFGIIMKDIKFEIAAFSDTVFILLSYDPLSVANDSENRANILVSIAGKLICGIMADAISKRIFPRGLFQCVTGICELAIETQIIPQDCE